MEAALLCACTSAVCAGITGMPFIFAADSIASLLSKDQDIIRYCSLYIHVQGFVMACIGFEIAAFGAMLGAGKASYTCFINGSMNIARIPLCSACLYHRDGFFPVLLWLLGWSNHNTLREKPTGTFKCLCLIIAATAVFKALFFAIWLGYRWCSGVYFSDSYLVGMSTNDASDSLNSRGSASTKRRQTTKGYFPVSTGSTDRNDGDDDTAGIGVREMCYFGIDDGDGNPFDSNIDVIDWDFIHDSSDRRNEGASVNAEFVDICKTVRPQDT